MATVLTWTNSSGAAVAVALDVAERQGFEATAEPTEHAVERGANISDHVKPGNDTFTVEGLVTDSLFIDDGRVTGARGSVQSTEITVGGKRVTLATFQWSQAFDRVRLVDGLLLDAVKSGALVTYSSSLRGDVADCVITRYRVDREAGTGTALPLTLELRRVRLVSVRRVEVPDPAQRRGQQRGQRGSQPATTPAAARRTALQNLVAAARGAT